MWDRITIGVTKSTYVSGYTTPNSYNRCEVRTSLHFNDADRTKLDTALPTYMFDSETLPTKLGMQFRPDMLRDNNILYGKDSASK